MNSLRAHAMIDDDVAVDAVLDELRAAAEPGATYADERRLQIKAYNQWMALLGARTYPAIDALDPGASEFAANSVLLDFTAGADKPRLTWVGEQLRAECGVSAGADLSSVPPGSLVSRLTDHYHEILVNRAPIGFEAEFVSRGGQDTLYRGVLMPFSSDDRTIDHLYGVISWKVLAGPATADALAAELGRTRFPGAGGATPVESAVASSLSEAVRAARCDAIEAELAIGAGRAALTRALAATYDLACRAESLPALFAELIAEAGFTPTDKPFADIVRLVFGGETDEAALAEHAAILAHARRSGVPRQGFATFVDAHRGGVKGVVRAANAAQVAADSGWTQRLREALAAVAPHAIGGEGELLLARRQPDGAIAIVASLPGINDPASRDR